MAVYIKLEDAVEAFKKAEADDIERYGAGLLIVSQQKELLILSVNVINI